MNIHRTGVLEYFCAPYYSSRSVRRFKNPRGQVCFFTFGALIVLGPAQLDSAKIVYVVGTCAKNARHS